MKDEKFPTFPTLPGEIKEEESRYTFRANNYEEALSRMILDCLKKPQSELSAQKLGVHAATNFCQMATARLESGERFELAITGNFEPPLPVKDRPSNVECSVLDFTERGREVADALIKTARTMMDEANAGNVPPAFILYGGFRVSETGHNIEFSLTCRPASILPGFAQNDASTG
jgi:hypothetical protein